MKVKAEAGDVAWQRARADDASFDLSPLFPEAREGIAYAAFYADVRAQQTVYFDLQSVLGARVFANGFPMRAVRAAAVSAAGLDRFLLTFQRGTNLVVLEIPGATFEGLA